MQPCCVVRMQDIVSAEALSLRYSCTQSVRHAAERVREVTPHPCHVARQPCCVVRMQDMVSAEALSLRYACIHTQHSTPQTGSVRKHRPEPMWPLAVTLHPHHV
eukprot:54211-Eustigmatos_ZCMA.PRE.1